MAKDFVAQSRVGDQLIAESNIPVYAQAEAPYYADSFSADATPDASRTVSFAPRILTRNVFYESASGTTFATVLPAAVPEPGTIVLVVGGIAVLGLVRARRGTACDR